MLIALSRRLSSSCFHHTVTTRQQHHQLYSEHFDTPRLSIASRTITMTFARAFARASRAIPKAHTARTAGRRTYSTQKIHAETKSGSDLPWVLGAVGVTLPACFYILKASPEEAHHLEMPHAPHGDQKWPPMDKDMDLAMAKNQPKHPEKEEGDEEELKDAAPAEKEEKDDSSEESEAKPEDKENKDLDKSDISNEGAKPAENDYQGDNTIKKIPGDKGATKLRKDSTNAIKAGTDDKVVHSDDPRAPKDVAAASKTAGNLNTQSGKQEKLSNTDTKHSRDIGKGSGLSQKGEGTPETSKSKGTVDPEDSEGKANEMKEDHKEEKSDQTTKEKGEKSDDKEDN